MKHETAKLKPSVEFYIDKSMGLCAERFGADGRGITAQYLDRKVARDWLEAWLDEYNVREDRHAGRAAVD